MVGTGTDDDSVQESEPRDRDDDDANLVLSLPESHQEGNKMEEEKEVEVREENDTSEVTPSDTSNGSNVQEEDGQGSKDNLEGDDTESEVYGKDSKEVSDSSEGSK
eukprot:3212350-Ditylum_brightwellii.AAC.1